MLKVNTIKNNFASSGKVEWIGLRALSNSATTAKKALHVKSAEAMQNHGLVGDKAGQKPGGNRQITLFQHEYLAVIASLLNKKSVQPVQLRRNIVVSGINLAILKGKQVKIHDAIIEITGNCAPCAKMEHVLGFGGFNAMRNHGGVTAKVIRGGIISLGDEVKVLASEDSLEEVKTETDNQTVLF